MSKTQKISVLSFLIIELILYIFVVFIKPTNITHYLSFITIILCFGFSFFAFSVKEKSYLTHLALLFTVIADIFLVLVRPQIQTFAMVSFSIVQMFYFARILLENNNKKINIINIIIRISLIIIALIVTAIILKNKTDFLSIISVFYYINLILNCIFSFLNKNTSILLKLGLLFFLFCDTFVGLQCMGQYLSINPNSLIYNIIFYPFDFVWFFYVPAQVLLCLSIFKFKKNLE